ncbi:PucR family transcriptional regulator [Salimicrobium halophilum]|uniref:DNA-binding transcriptional regulator, PucR family n=1 Tax=Salimicrobium halophilum TaxID=86666 RepID=A0A1G8T3N9_9BACI|nr:helix-turn-helix domain-containing protein [Salimicrobium halophilum]SDJ35290.1 DNA-binding transcriptional regulator, PucR family [Salimicrobium halophilum]
MNHTKEIPDSPEGLADYIADELGCPVTIEDANHRILSYSKHETNVDDARTATIMRRKVPERVVNGLWKEGVMGELFESTSPVFVSPIPSIGLGNRIAISVWKNKEVLGFIWAQTEEVKVSTEQLEKLREASRIAARHLIKQRDRKRKNEENVQEFIWQLFNGAIASQTEIDKRARQVDLSLKGHLCVVIFEFTEAITPTVKRHASYLTETLHQTNIAGRMFDDNHLYLLTRTKEETDTATLTQTLIEDFTKKLKERIGFEEVRGVYGKICSTPKELDISYQQALKVLEMKAQHPEPLKHTDNFQDLGVYQFLDEIARLYEKEGFQNETIQAIRTYDHKNNGHMLETLRAFLSHNSNSHQAAKSLHIHTNTLLYRLKRIRDITGADLNDANEKTKLFIDLLIDT